MVLRKQLFILELAEVSFVFPPLSPPPLSTPAGAERGAEQPYLAACFEGSLTRRRAVGADKTTELQLALQQANCPTACKTSVNSVGQIRLLAPLSAPAGVERGWGRGGGYESLTIRPAQNKQQGTSWL